MTFFIINNEKVKVELEIFEKLPDEIKNQLLNSGEYFIQAPVSKSIFDSFCEYIKDNNKTPSINLSNIEDYILLNNELKVLTDYINKFKFVDLSRISLCCKENIDTSETEKHIAQNLDYFLSNYFDEMYNIPIPKLLNIMNHKEKILKNIDKAYEFFQHGLEKNSNYSIFFNLIDALDLSKESINDFISQKDKYFGFQPKLNISFIKGIYDQLKELKFQQEQAISKMMQNQYDKYEKNIIVYDLEIQPNETVTFNIPLFSNVIHDDLFICNQKLVSIQLPPSVIRIAEKAFSNLKSLKYIKLSHNLNSIGSNAFKGCESLEQIEFSPYLINIEDYAFSGCSSLKKLQLPSSLASLGSNTFSICIKLEHIELPNTLTIISNGLFDGCSMLKYINIPESVTKINSYAFRNCTSLEKIIIPSSVTSIEYCSFNGCSSLKEVNIPESINIISNGTFKGCSSLKEIEIPCSVKKIEQSAFENCLLIVKIPKTLVDIDQTAFKTSNGQIQKIYY